MCQISQTILYGRDAILRVRDKWLIFNMILQLWADVKYHVPTGFGFSPKASGFYPFDDATDLASEGGGGYVVWKIQASASNHKPKGRFFWYAFGIYKPKEPSLWFERTVPLVCGLRQRLESATPHHQRRSPQRGRWHRQKDKNRSPSAKNQTR